MGSLPWVIGNLAWGSQHVAMLILQSINSLSTRDPPSQPNWSDEHELFDLFSLRQKVVSSTKRARGLCPLLFCTVGISKVLDKKVRDSFSAALWSW
jgi:hypothetical protein